MVSGVATTVVNTLVLAIGYPLYLHYLGYEKYGVWLVLATVLNVAQIGNLGVDRAVMKIVAEESGRRNLEGIQRYVATALVILVVSGTISLVVILALKTQIVALFKLSEEDTTTALWLLPYLGCLSIYVLIAHTLSAVVSGLGRMDLANWIESVGRMVAVSASGLLLSTGRGIESLLVGSTLSYVLIHILSVVAIHRLAAVRLLRLKNLRGGHYHPLLRLSLGFFGGSLLTMLLSPFNRVMLSRHAGVSSIPIYEIAYNAGMQVRGLIEAGLRALMPEISRMGTDMTDSARERIRQMLKRVHGLIFKAGIPLYLLLIILAALILRLWLGERYVEGLATSFRIMAIGSFASLLGVPAYFTLMGLGRSRCIFLAHAAQSIVNVLIVLGILAATMSISVNGVAWAVFFSMCAATSYLVWETQRALSARVHVISRT